MPTHSCWCIALLAPLFLLLLSVSNNTIASNKKYDVTALLMTKLLAFVSWPENSRNTKQPKPTLCILEETKRASIKPLLLSNGVLNKYFIISEQNHSNNCHVIFISKHTKSHLKQLLSEIKQQGEVLTFSATDKYARNGVMINFYTENQNVRFEVNWKVMKLAGLSISSRILKIARLVE